MPNEEPLVELEDRAANLVSKDIRRQLERIGQQALAALATLGDHPTPAQLRTLRAELAEKLRAVTLGPVAAVLARVVSEAVDLGIAEALSDVDRPQETVKKPRPDMATRTTVAGAAARARDHLRRAEDGLGEALSLTGILRVMSRANMAVTTLERTARWAVNRAVATGANRVAVQLGVSRLWIAERDACVHCLAYSGKVAAPGKKFPGGLTFGEKPLSREKLPHPPLHPNCRCRITPWSGSRSGVGDVEMPEALEREARRSILRGTSLPSESESARVAAAGRLLERGVLAPQSVRAVARRAVRAGRFR